jgi:hypothetical protein
MDRRSDVSILMQKYVGIQNPLRTKLRRDKLFLRVQMRSKRRTCFKFVIFVRKVEVETHISGLTGGRSRDEAFKTYEIFKVREERESSGGGVVVTIGLSIVRYLDHGNSLPDN